MPDTQANDSKAIRALRASDSCLHTPSLPFHFRGSFGLGGKLRRQQLLYQIIITGMLARERVFAREGRTSEGSIGTSLGVREKLGCNLQESCKCCLS